MTELIFNNPRSILKNDIKDAYDLVIIGAGPAGLTAAIYAARGKLSTLVLEKELVGGEIEKTDIIENYPGFPEGVTGHALAERMSKQAEKFGAKIVYGTIDDFDFQSNPKTIHFNGKKIRTNAVIIATGTSPKKLKVPGEDKLIGHGVSFCATCDAPFFANSEVAIVGCGNSGLQEGLFILKYVKTVHFIEYLPKSPAEKTLIDRIQEHSNVNCHYQSKVVAINGDTRVTSITVENLIDQKKYDIPVQGVFIYVGLVPNTQLFRGKIKLDENGYIMTDEQLQTSVPGVFAAGDVRDKNLYQITTAVADGSIAAVSAEKYIENLRE